uniref:Uncharacterized protein n=1 Tax=Romanomermis culicivorax TaxID=13658 RepID=A0A915JX21_ROMCU
MAPSLPVWRKILRHRYNLATMERFANRSRLFPTFLRFSIQLYFYFSRGFRGLLLPTLHSTALHIPESQMARTTGLVDNRRFHVRKFISAHRRL